MFPGGDCFAQDAYLFTTIAGQIASAGSTDGVAANARFNQPQGISAHADGGIYISDSGNSTIRKISGGVVTTWAGQAGLTGTRDAVGNDARFGQTILSNLLSGPGGLVVSFAGTVYVADSGNVTIRAIAPDRAVSTIAGVPLIYPEPGTAITGPLPSPSSVDGTGTPGASVRATFFSPFGVAVDASGAIFVSDTYAQTIRKITPGGLLPNTSTPVPFAVTTYAGFKSQPGHRDGPRETTMFREPAGLASDSAGNLYIADSGNYVIRKISPTGVVTTLAGTKELGGAADGTGAEARFGAYASASVGGLSLSGAVAPNGPAGLAVDAGGYVFVADTWNHTIRKISPGGQVTTIGGTAGLWGAVDGLGSAARFAAPFAVTVDKDGNVYVADTGSHTIRKGVPVFRPQFRSSPQSVTAVPGQTVTLAASVSGTPAPALQWTRSGSVLPGATNSSLVLTDVQPGDSGTYVITATNVAGSAVSSGASVTVGAAPIITTQPASQNLLGGESVTLVIAASGQPTPAIQWLRDGVAIPGATTATLTIAAVEAGDAGSYTARVTNTAGSTDSDVGVVTVNTSRLVNLSIRTALSSSAPLLSVGFVVSKSEKNLLIRGVGPGLGQFGLGGTLEDPRVAVFAGATARATNDNWGSSENAATVAVTAAQAGAFPLPTGSSDAALLETFSEGAYSAQVGGGPTASSGIVLVELYDTNPRKASRLINVSARAQVGIGDNILAAGFVLAGNSRKTLLIRAIGPTLAAFGVSGVLADPLLEIYRAGEASALAMNDNWGGSAALSAAFAARGAFPMSANDSKDAALLVTLEPGSYTAKVSGANASIGEALVEIYELP